MDKCREEFEKIEWVKDRLKYVWWSQNNEYCDTGKHPRTNASFLNGALHLFREQQAKVEKLENQFDQHDKLLLQRNKDVEELYDINEKHAAEKAELQKRVDAAELKLKEIANIAMRARRGEYYTESGRNAGLNIAAQIEQALKGGCKHESDGSHLLSKPPKTKCKKCGEIYSADVLKGEGCQ